jgi:hypothetical protein
MEILTQPIFCVWGWNLQLFTAVQGKGAFLNGKRIYGGSLVSLLIESGCIRMTWHAGDLVTSELCLNCSCYLLQLQVRIK